MMKKSISWMVFLLLMTAACAQAAPQLTNVTADGESLHAGEGWTVSFETTEGGALAMQLRGTEGETVDLGATQVDAGSGQLVWDGVLPDGSEAADGVYTVAVQLRNYWGEESEESLLPLTIGETKEELEAAYRNYEFTVTPGNFTIKTNEADLTVAAEDVDLALDSLADAGENGAYALGEIVRGEGGIELC